MRELDESLSAVSNELEALNGSIAEKEGQIETTKGELEQAKETEKKQYESMKLRIKYMYERGDTSYVELFMESDSLSELLNKAEYISKISEYDRQMLDQYAATKDEIAADEARLETEHAELLDLKEQTEIKQASVEQLLSAKQAELRSYESQIAEAENQLSEYEKDLEAQEAAIRQIEEEIKRQEEEARRKAEAAGQSYVTKDIGDIHLSGHVRPAAGSPPALAGVRHRPRARPAITRASTSAPRQAATSWRPQRATWWFPRTARRPAIM